MLARKNHGFAEAHHLREGGSKKLGELRQLSFDEGVLRSDQPVEANTGIIYAHSTTSSLGETTPLRPGWRR
jgi:hypothetical protein